MSNTEAFHDEFPTHAVMAPAEEPSQILKRGDTFALFDRYGDLSPERSAGKAGIYHCGTRFLSRYELKIFGQRPLLLDSSVTGDGRQLRVDLMNPDCRRDSRVVLSKGLLHIQRTLVLQEGGFVETIAITNFGGLPCDLEFERRFDADFRDVFEVRGAIRAHRGSKRPLAADGDTLDLSYCGLDGISRHVCAQFQPAPTRFEGSWARFTATLAPAATHTLHVQATFALEGGDAPPAKRPARANAPAAGDPPHESAAEIQSSSAEFNELLQQCERDLRMLTTQTPEGPYPYAGVPWYSTIFGRDGIITALQRLWLEPEMSRGVLACLAASQASARNSATEAEPGKIIHEQRAGEMANTGEIPFGRYYGSVDSTPLFVLLAGAYLERTADVALARSIWPHVLRALEWIDQFGDLDGDGFFEYPALPDQPLTNQCWKDSADTIFHQDGTLARGPIAVCEVQAYVYAARLAARQIALVLQEAERAASLAAQAEELRRKFEHAFWLEDLGTYAIALDGEKRPCAVLSSNAGHSLATGIATAERALRVGDQMLSPAFFSGWGVRTIAAGQRGYNPMSYHNGSVWPHDCGMIARGLARYGRKAQAAQILAGLFDLSHFVDAHRLPELICGFDRQPGLGPALYPVTCLPQAWAAGSIFMILEACLGISIDAASQVVKIQSPHLPAFLDTLTVSRLRVGDTDLNLSFTRKGGQTHVQAAPASGPVRVVVQS